MNNKELYDWRLVASQLAAMSSKLMRACDVLEAAAKAEQLLDQVRRLTTGAAAPVPIVMPSATGAVAPVGMPSVAVLRTLPSSPSPVVDRGVVPRPPGSVSMSANVRPQLAAVDQVRALAARHRASSSSSRHDIGAGSRPLDDLPF